MLFTFSQTLALPVSGLCYQTRFLSRFYASLSSTALSRCFPQQKKNAPWSLYQRCQTMSCGWRSVCPPRTALGPDHRHTRQAAALPWARSRTHRRQSRPVRAGDLSSFMRPLLRGMCTLPRNSAATEAGCSSSSREIDRSEPRTGRVFLARCTSQAAFHSSAHCVVHSFARVHSFSYSFTSFCS